MINYSSLVLLSVIGINSVLSTESLSAHDARTMDSSISAVIQLESKQICKKLDQLKSEFEQQMEAQKGNNPGIRCTGKTTWQLLLNALIINALTEAANSVGLHLDESGDSSSHHATASAEDCRSNDGIHSEWRVIQEGVANTVVQIFSSKTEFNWIEPYKTPEQWQSRGSGFFINDDGELITNAHVVNGARNVALQVPVLGKARLEVDIIGVCPERDLALLRLKPESKKLLEEALGKISFLPLGNSDLLVRSDDVLALGYPLGEESLKSTTGVISGKHGDAIQISAPINPGSSGGPLLNKAGEVVGVNSSKVIGADNVGYIVPVNVLKNMLDDLRKEKLLRQPFFGICICTGGDALARFLGNPSGGGVYVSYVFRGTTLEDAGVLVGDVLYEIDGHPIDYYGELQVPWSEDRVSISDCVARMKVGNNIKLVIYRRGERKEILVKLRQHDLDSIRKIYPEHEKVEFESIGGLIVMELTINHLLQFGSWDLSKYWMRKNRVKPRLVISHIFLDSLIQKERVLSAGTIIDEVNGEKVGSIEEFRKALSKSCDTDFLTIKTENDDFVVIPFRAALQDELRLASIYFYTPTPTVKDLMSRVAKEQNGVV